LAAIAPGSVRTPVIAPRWQTPLPDGVVGTWGTDVEGYALSRGIVLDRAQLDVIDRALAYDADERLVHRLYLISWARQNGKSAIVRMIVGWALTAKDIPPWARILGVAFDRGQARLIYEPVMSDLEPQAGPELAVTRYLGIRSDLHGHHREYHVGSKESRNAARGTSNDLVIFDEVRTQIDYELWNTLEPTTRARPQPLIIATSTAGDDRSVLLREWWERGRRIIDGAEPFAGFGMTWYAADDDISDPEHPEHERAVLQANPAVAEGRIPLGSVASSVRTLSRPGYMTETLNLWSSSTDEWLPPGVWLRQTADRPGEATRIVLGVEAVGTWRRATVTVGLVTDSGAWVGIAGELESTRTASSSVAPSELVALVARLAKEWKATEVAFSRSAASGDHIEAWCAESGVKAIPMQSRQIRAASQLFRSELIGGRLGHADDPLLTQQVRDARPSHTIDEDWYFSIPESVGEIDALRAAAWAAWAAIEPQEPDIGSQVFV
jgi:phage terminase large subunit-like protein